jgi:hypothetical protein
MGSRADKAMNLPGQIRFVERWWYMCQEKEIELYELLFYQPADTPSCFIKIE